MSDITTHTVPDPLDVGEDITAADPLHPQDIPSPIPDDAIPAVAAQLREIFAEIAKAAAAEAIAATPVPTFRPGTVQGANLTTGDITVLMDGDTSTITVQTIAGLPVYNDRVMICFVPPSTAFIIGFIGRGGVGVPAGTIIPYGGIITNDSSTSTLTAPPSGYLWCRGQVVAQASYPALFAAIGTTFNTGGEASTDFRLPDLRGRIPLGLDDMGGDAGRLDVSGLGTTGGSQYHTLSTSQLPGHVHSLNGHTHNYTPEGSVTAISGSVTSTLSATTTAHSLTLSSGVPVWDGSNGTLGFVYAPSTWTAGAVSGTASGSFSGAAGTFTGTANPTLGPSTADTGSAGSGNPVNNLPPYILVHYIIKG